MTIARRILNLLLQHSRILQVDTLCEAHHHQNCFQHHLGQLEKQVAANACIQFILPAFPAKSPNQEKTASIAPDLGEILALRFLNELCEKISEFYAPGAEIVICSDGRVFNDLVQVRDNEVDAYADGIRHIVKSNALKHIHLYSLDDVYSHESYPNMRHMLVEVYGEAVEVIKKNILSDAVQLAMFNGIHRFIYEDNLSLSPHLSKNQVRQLAKPLTYSVIQRSNAWSKFLEIQFPDAVRLSIHPQPCDSKKLGIMLLKADSLWATPWHRVTLQKGDEYCLIRKQEAIALGATAVYENRVFSHFIMGGLL